MVVHAGKNVSGPSARKNTTTKNIFFRIRYFVLDITLLS